MNHEECVLISDSHRWFSKLDAPLKNKSLKLEKAQDHAGVWHFRDFFVVAPLGKLTEHVNKLKI